jgi:hypothetical protein
MSESDTINGEFNDSLREDAEQFGGVGESTTVPTHHIRVTSADLADFADSKGTLSIGDVVLVRRNNPPEEKPNADFVVYLSESALNRLASGEVVDYGIRHINGENVILLISKGGISDLFEDDRSPTQRICEEQPHLADYIHN